VLLVRIEPYTTDRDRNPALRKRVVELLGRRIRR
jgi:hypothetical protein